MNAITLPVPIATSDETVTFSRAAWNALLEQIEDAEDLESVRKYDAWVDAVGPDEARRLCYTADEAHRILNDGVSDITIWRDRAGLTQRALAEAAGISASYLAEIETGKKPGSAVALLKLAKVLRVPMEHLVAGDTVAASPEPESAGT